jgi:helicase
MKIEELRHHGVPEKVLHVLKDGGIERLFEPQEIAVNQGILDLESSFLISVPTASGKTLIAELMMVRAILQERQSGNRVKCLYIVPLKALASEKYETFKRWDTLGIRTGISTGDMDSSDPWLDNYDIIIATSEKVDSLIRHGTDWLKDIMILVVDEIHLIHDSRRGPTLEVTIARMRHFQPRLLILGLSATVQNAGEIAAWLDARLIESSWRPVELREGVYYNQSILFNDSHLKDVQVQGGNPKDTAISLAVETVKEDGQSLVFLNTRRTVESFADGIDLSEELSTEEKARLEGLSTGVLRALPEPTKTCIRLARCIKKGAAFHHAGLLLEQRRLVESGFRNNFIKVVSATPTLAAGVNLPARRVIIKDYHRYDANLGRVQIPVLEYKQMAGRAGRPEYDTYGEAVLISKTEDERGFLLDSYVLAEPEEIYSKLAMEASLRVHVLSAIASNFANSFFGLLEFFSKTLFAFQRDIHQLQNGLEKILAFLEKEKMIKRAGKSKESLITTPFGTRVSQLYIDPLSAVVLRDALIVAERKETVELSYLHTISTTGELGGLYLRRKDFETFSPVFYENMSCLLAELPEEQSPWDIESVLSEIKMASFLYDWVNEHGDEEIRERYALAPGDIKNKVEIAGWMLYCMRELGRLIGFSKTREIKNLEVRVKHGIKEELLELVSLRGVGRVRARMLYRRGFKKLKDIREADADALAKVKAIGEKIARSLKEQV